MLRSILSIVRVLSDSLCLFNVYFHPAWVLKDYTSEKLDLTSPDTFREYVLLYNTE